MTGTAMDSSTSPPPDPASQPEPEYRLLTTQAEQFAAVERLVALARLSIRVFDRDLSQLGWNTPGRAEALAAFLRRSSNAKLEIIVHDTRWLESSAPRLTGLLRHWGHAVTIYRTGAEARAAADAMVLVDGRHYLHRFHVDQPRAAVGLSMPAETRPLADRFAEIWATGEPGLSATTLGL